ncbi:hypothetical protein M5D96_010090 [Drosophila gunungcola]|uniref:Uncharacterized protein n=1 Tax=Drosophila gunungcola TaxID=103775 RepID=A0A9Q0BMX4_9MUSC|nr:hypothetical protein M5D96_010090 [Drosophila gunungcola]
MDWANKSRESMGQDVWYGNGIATTCQSSVLSTGNKV